MKILHINNDGTLSLPKNLCSKFIPGDELIALEEGNTIVIKPLTAFRKLSNLPKVLRSKPVSLKTAVRETHRARKSRT